MLLARTVRIEFNFRCQVENGADMFHPLSLTFEDKPNNQTWLYNDKQKAIDTIEMKIHRNSALELGTHA